MIRFEHVTKEFPNASVPAVRDINLQVDEGDLVVLLGPSGCGKTTTLKMVNRLYDPTSGTIYLDGTDVREMEVTALRRRIGYVIQQGGLFPHMTVAQNVAVVPELLGWPAQKINDRVDELLSLVLLPPGEFRHRYPSQLSGGQQQRVGVARALAADPKVILMDEPFGAVDAITRAELQCELGELHKKVAKTILFVTHDVDEAIRLADEIVIMRDGGIVQHGTPLEILVHPADEFVSRLVGADDMVRGLSLLRVESAMDRLPVGFTHDDEPTILMQDDLRQALSRLLQTGARRLTVLADGRPVGVVTMSSIRASQEETMRDGHELHSSES